MRWPDPEKRPRGSHRVTFEYLVAAVGDFLDPGMVLVVDESCAMYASTSLRIETPGGYASQAAWGSIGYAVAGAIGVGLGAKARPVVLIGDGGFQMTCQALSTLRSHPLGAVVLIVDNATYAIEQAVVDLGPFDPKPGAFRRYNELPAWDYAAIARAMGGLGLRVRTVAKLDAALERARERTRGLTVIAAAIDRHQLPDEVRRLATDTGFPRHEHCPPRHADVRREDLRAKVARGRRASRKRTGRP
jgi:indolepyruvate decarboxylase